MLEVTAEVYYLVCSDICVPEGTDLSIDIQVGEPLVDGRWNDAIDLAIAQAPKAGPITGAVEKTGPDATYTFQNLPEGTDISSVHFFAIGESSRFGKEKRRPLTAFGDGISNIHCH